MTENRTHERARDLAMRLGRDIYIILDDQNRFRTVPESQIPRDVEPLAGYHPSGNLIRGINDDD